MADLYAFSVWADGECRDADDNLLDSNGNRIDPEPPTTNEVQQEDR